MDLREVIIRDSKGVCPYCSGLLVAVEQHVSYRCIDCGKAFMAMGEGYAKDSVVMTAEVKLLDAGEYMGDGIILTREGIVKL